MSFDNNEYPNRKDWIKPYRKSKRFDRTCRNHGSCPRCMRDRLHRRIVLEESADMDLREFILEGANYDED
jgi:hypothetical protein